MKHRLPTLGQKSAGPTMRGEQREQQRSRAISQDWATRPMERPPVAVPVLAIAHHEQVLASVQLAQDLCAAFVREGASVAALATVDKAALAAEAEHAWTGMMEAGARQAKLLRKPQQDPRAVLESTLAALAKEADWVIAWGNVLPQLLQPTFTVVVTGHRRDLANTGALVMQAQLEVTAPTPELATLLARNLVRGEQA
jgi:hypothetical protein